MDIQVSLNKCVLNMQSFSHFNDLSLACTQGCVQFKQIEVGYIPTLIISTVKTFVFGRLFLCCNNASWQ